MADDWAKLQACDFDEMKIYPVGTRVKLRMMGGRFHGKIVETQSPEGLLSARYKVKLDNGEVTQFLHDTDIVKI